MKCCQIDRDSDSILPFTSTLLKGFYDGPLDGITTCEICKQGFFYKEIDYISCDIRVYHFTKIFCNHYDFASRFGIKIETGEYVDFPRIDEAEKLYNQFNEQQITHLALTSGFFSLKARFWRKATEEDMVVKNWEEYLNIQYDEETEYCWYPVTEKRPQKDD